MRIGISHFMIAVLTLASLLVSGCIGARDVARTFGSNTSPRKDWDGDPVAFSTVKTIMVLPFADRSPQPGFDALAFATKLANQLRTTGKFKVIYPKTVLERAGMMNREIARANNDYQKRQMLGTSIVEARQAATKRANQAGRENIAAEDDKPRARIDPVHNLRDALQIGRTLRADAIIVGQIDDYDPYTQPRVSLNLSVVATGVAEGAAQELAELAQWGVPRRTSTTHGAIWSVQFNIDSRAGNIGSDIKVHGWLRHTERNAYDTDIYRASPRMFYSYVGTKLSGMIVQAKKEAVEEAEKRALVAARVQQTSQAAVKQRIQELINPQINLPHPERITALQNRDRRSKGWRPDVYNDSHPKKAARLYAPQPQNPPAPSAKFTLPGGVIVGR